MPNWCGNVVAVFVPRILEPLVPRIVEAMRGRDDRDGRINWFDLERLAPCPDEIVAGFSKRIVEAVEGDGIALLLPAQIREKLCDGGRMSDEDRAAAVAALPDDLQDEAGRALACLDRHGLITQAQWQLDRWGVRYCECDDEPRIDEAPDDEYEEPETVMIKWVFETPNTWPREAALTLARICRQWGFGLRWWISDQDDGSSWNPVSDEYMTVWRDASSEAPMVTVASRTPACLTDAVTMMGKPFSMMLEDEQIEEEA